MLRSHPRGRSRRKFADNLLSVSSESEDASSAGDRDSPNTWLVDSLLLETRVARINA